MGIEAEMQASAKENEVPVPAEGGLDSCDATKTSPTKRGAGVSADAPDAKRQALSPVVGPASAPEGDAEMGEVKMDRPAFVAKPVKEVKAGLELRAQRDERVASHRGCKGCLEGLTFVVSGALASLERDEVTKIIEAYGGKASSAVGSKTSYLVVGFEPGQSKVDKAKKKKTPIIDEDGLLELISHLSPDTEAKLTVNLKPLAKASVTVTGSVKMAPEEKIERAAKVERELAPQLWVDKHKPMSMAHLVGNTDKVRSMLSWLKNWGQNNAGDTKSKGGGGGYGGGGYGGGYGGGNNRDDGGVGKKAVLITGPPGVGKSSAARIVAEEAGYDVIELNASDERNGKGLRESLFLTKNHTLAGFFGPSAGKAPAAPSPVGGGGKKRTCVIMDECDGMSSGDRGGMAELISIIKETKTPIICIANDYYDRKISSLKGHCYDLKFAKPLRPVVVKRLAEIARIEGFEVPNPQAIDKLYESAGGDLRHVINVMQTWRLRTSSLTVDSIADEMKMGGKEQSSLQQSVFEISNDWFMDVNKNRNASVSDRLEMFFYDSDLIPLLFQENYLKTKISLTQQEMGDADMSTMMRACEAADLISQSDVVNNSIRKNQQWGLLPLQGILSTVHPGFKMRGIPSNFYSNELWRRQCFTKALGHMSTMNKKTRLVCDIERCMKLSTSANRTEVGSDYLPLLRARLTKPLLASGADGIDEVLAFMEDYHFTRDEFETITSELRVNDRFSPDVYAQVESKVKAALTRKYNKESHKIAFVKGKGVDAMAGRSKAGGNIGRSGEFEKEGEEREEEEEEEEEEGPVSKQAQAAGGAAGASSGGSSKSSGKGKGGGGSGKAKSK